MLLTETWPSPAAAARSAVRSVRFQMMGASYGAILLGVAFTLLGLISPEVAQRYDLKPIAPGVAQCRSATVSAG